MCPMQALCQLDAESHYRGFSHDLNGDRSNGSSYDSSELRAGRNQPVWEGNVVVVFAGSDILVRRFDEPYAAADASESDIR